MDYHALHGYDLLPVDIDLDPLLYAEVRIGPEGVGRLGKYHREDPAIALIDEPFDHASQNLRLNLEYREPTLIQMLLRIGEPEEKGFPAHNRLGIDAGCDIWLFYGDAGRGLEKRPQSGIRVGRMTAPRSEPPGQRL